MNVCGVVHGDSSKCWDISVQTRVTDGFCLSQFYSKHLFCFSLWFSSFSPLSPPPSLLPCTVRPNAHFLPLPSPLPQGVFDGLMLLSPPPSSYVFKEGRWLYLSGFSVLKRSPERCRASLPVWAKLRRKKRAKAVCVFDGLENWKRK